MPLPCFPVSILNGFIENNDDNGVMASETIENEETELLCHHVTIKSDPGKLKLTSATKL
jgi:hypothetical protein